MKTCPICGAVNEDENKFCQSCGSSMSNDPVITPDNASKVEDAEFIELPKSDAAPTENTVNPMFNQPTDTPVAEAPVNSTPTEPQPEAPQTTYGSIPEPQFNPGAQSQQTNQNMNANGQPQYTYNVNVQAPTQPASNGYDTCGLIGFICAIVSFVLDPIYLVTLAAVVLCIIGIVGAKKNKVLSIVGLCIAPVAFIGQLIFDILTFGIGILF